MRDGTPLPVALSGNTIERLIRIDEALIYLVNGALEYLCDKEPFEETGTLTIENAKLALSEMFWAYFTEQPMKIPVGATMTWHMSVAPSGWLMCDGGAVYVAEWPELFALWGYKYGGAGTQFGLIDMRSFSPFGAGGDVSLDDTAGELEHTLTEAEIPSHVHRVPKQSATINAGVNVVTPAARTDNPAAPHVTTDATGGGMAHNTLHPVRGVNWIVYGGKQVT